MANAMKTLLTIQHHPRLITPLINLIGDLPMLYYTHTNNRASHSLNFCKHEHIQHCQDNQISNFLRRLHRIISRTYGRDVYSGFIYLVLLMMDSSMATAARSWSATDVCRTIALCSAAFMKRPISESALVKRSYELYSPRHACHKFNVILVWFTGNTLKSWRNRAHDTIDENALISSSSTPPAAYNTMQSQMLNWRFKFHCKPHLDGVR